MPVFKRLTSPIKSFYVPDHHLTSNVTGNRRALPGPGSRNRRSLKARSLSFLWIKANVNPILNCFYEIIPFSPEFHVFFSEAEVGQAEMKTCIRKNTVSEYCNY